MSLHPSALRRDPQNDVVYALARPARCPEPVGDHPVEPDSAFAPLVSLGIDAHGPAQRRLCRCVPPQVGRGARRVVARKIVAWQRIVRIVRAVSMIFNAERVGFVFWMVQET